jgi:spermidine synthase
MGDRKKPKRSMPSAAPPDPLQPAVRGARLHLSDALLLAAFFCSGAAALGLELIWMRLLRLAFGSETFGMLGVLTGFFAGLAIGAAILHGPVLRSARPALIYVAAELVIAGCAIAGPIVLLGLARWLPPQLWPLVGDNQSLGALTLDVVVATVLLLPATIPMGAAIVAIVEAWRRQRHRAAPGHDNTVAWLYAANTAGATLGVLAAVHTLTPALGVVAASIAFGGMSFAGAVLVWVWQRSAASARRPGSSAEREAAAADAESRRLLYALLFGTGLAGIGIESVGMHVLAQIYDNTIHTLANILAVWLAGTALGAWVYAMLVRRSLLGSRDATTRMLLWLLAATATLSAVALAQAAKALAVAATPGTGYGTRLFAETGFAAVVFGPSTLVMGAAFSHLVGYFTREGIGHATAVNNAGAALAPVVFGVVLVPLWGYGVAYYAAVGAYLLLFVAASLAHRGSPRWLAAGAGVVAAVAAIAFSPLVLVQFPRGASLLAQRIGLQGVVSVTEGPGAAAPSGDAATRILQVNQKQFMGGLPGFITKRMGHLAMLVAPAPRRVLFLGVGTGITAGAALDYPIEKVTAVELVPEILDLLPWFEAGNHGLAGDSRVALHAADARRFVWASGERFDLIVADLYHPSRDGTASLYTLEHFAALREHLADEGVFVQWLPLYQLRPDDLKTIVRTFLRVFPASDSMVANYSGFARLALIGWARVDGGMDAARAETALRAHGDRVFDGLPDLLASYMLDADGLRRYAGEGPLNTDSNQRIAFDTASASDIERSVVAHRALASLLPFRRGYPDAFVRNAGRGGADALRNDVDPYAEAASRYLAAEIDRLDDRSKPMPDAALAAYLDAYAADVRFTLPIGKLLEYTLRDPARAREIVVRLATIHPTQPDVATLDKRLGAAPSPEQTREIVERFLRTGGD